MLRTMFAFLLAPFPAATIMAVFVAIRPRQGVAAVFAHPASMFVAFCLVTYALGLVLAVPTYVVLRRRGIASLRSHAFTGAAIPLAVFGPLAVWGVALGRISARIIGGGILIYAMLGLLTGAAFWFLARPDRRAAPGQVRAAQGRLLKTFE